jgi:hypothetical protein
MIKCKTHLGTQDSVHESQHSSARGFYSLVRFIAQSERPALGSSVGYELVLAGLRCNTGDISSVDHNLLPDLIHFMVYELYVCQKDFHII